MDKVSIIILLATLALNISLNCHVQCFALKNNSRSGLDELVMGSIGQDQQNSNQFEFSGEQYANLDAILELLNANDTDLNEFEIDDFLKLTLGNNNTSNFNDTDTLDSITNSTRRKERKSKSIVNYDKKFVEKLEIAKEKLRGLIENTTDNKTKNDLENILTEFNFFDNQSTEVLENDNGYGNGNDVDNYVEPISYHNHWQSTVQFPRYDKNIRPFHRMKPVQVQVSIHVIRVHSISESTMDFGLDIYYREIWKDPRLTFDPATYGEEVLNLPASAIEEIWAPDSYFPNAISATTDSPGSVTHRSLIKIYPNGTVFYIRKISLTADCAMNIELYPFDKQGCELIISSYSLLKGDLSYQWRDGDPVDFQGEVKLPEFKLLYHKPKAIDEVYYIGTYSTLHLCFIFQRSAGFCIMQIFFPATSVVMCSWVSLWMEEETQFNDVLAVILAIIFLAYAYNSVMPRVSYVKLLDLYLAACFLFVFLSLGKLVILRYCRKKWQSKHANKDRTAMDVFNKVVMAEEESSAIGSSDEEADVGKVPKNLNNNNNVHDKENHVAAGKVRRYSKAKAALQRRITMAKIHMEKAMKEAAAEKRFIRYVRIFHVSTQLVLPLGFASFFVFILVIYPNWPRTEPC